MAQPNVELFVEKIFGIKCADKDRHFANTSDRTIWYRVDRNNKLMFVPGMNVLRVNQPELEKFLAAVESFITFDLNDPMYDWEHLNLYSYNTREGIQKGLTWLLDSFESGQLVATDTETRYLKWDNNKLLAIGFAVDADTCLAFYNIPKDMYPLLQEVLASTKPRFAWHNGKFDKNFLWYTCGIRARVDEDSMLKHFAQVSEKKGTHGLKYLGPLYLQAPQWDDELDEMKRKYCRENKIKLEDFTYDLIPTNILIPYMQRDCIATYRLIDAFEKIKEPGTDRVYQLLIKATEAFSSLEINGATVSKDQLEKLRIQYTQDLARANDIVADAVSKLWNPVKYANDTGAKYVAEFSLNSPKQLKWLLQAATGIKVDSSDAKTIEKLNDLVESGTLRVDSVAKELFTGIMLSRKASKYLDTYVVGMTDSMRKDNRVSGTYNLHGTETGRLSSSNPNMQNCPRTKEVKNIFTVSPGYKMIQLDYSQCIAAGTLVDGLPIEQHYNAICKGKSKIVKIKTEKGYTVSCTKDHRVLTSTGFKEVCNLTKDDFIALQPQEHNPLFVDKLSRFVGFWVGDGSFNGNQTGISVARKGAECEQDVRNIIESAGFAVGYESEYSFGVKCGKLNIRTFLQENFDKKNLHIPEYLEYAESHSSLAEFIGGLFDADGTVVSTTISVATSQYGFAQDIQRCLLYFGVMSTLTKEHGGNNFVAGGKDYWRVQISDSYSIASFNTNIGFSIKYKRDKAEAIKDHRDYSNFLPTLTCDEVRASGADYRKYVFNYLHGRKYTRNKVLDLAIDQTHFKYQWDRFDRLCDAGEAIVYDLINEPENRFVANGIVVHNCELRVLGVLSNDPFLIQSYRDGKDLHANVAQKIFGPNFTHEQRTQCKTINFGIAYGRGASAIAEAFKMPKAEAQKLIDDWFEAMPMVEQYIKRQRKAARTGERQQTMFGRVRHYVVTDENMFHVENEYINTPIQSIASDLTVNSLVEIHNWLVDKGYYNPIDPAHSKVRIIITVHDSIVLEALDIPELVDEVAQHCQKVMATVPERLIPNCPLPFKADIETGYSWGALEE